MLNRSSDDFSVVLKLFTPCIRFVIPDEDFSSMMYEKINEYFICFRVGNRARGKQYMLELLEFRLAYNR